MVGVLGSNIMKYAAECGVYITVTFGHNIVINNINKFNNSVNVLYYNIIICLQNETKTSTQYLEVLRLILTIYIKIGSKKQCLQQWCTKQINLQQDSKKCPLGHKLLIWKEKVIPTYF